MKNKELMPKACPECGADPILVEYGSYASFSCTGCKKKTKLSPHTYHYDCACGVKCLFRMTTKRVAIIMWKRKEEAGHAIGDVGHIIHDDPELNTTTREVTP